MEELLRKTAAYRIVAGDVRRGTRSHAYMLVFADQDSLRDALKIFARALYGADERAGRRITEEIHPDVPVYPRPGERLDVAAAEEIVDGCSVRPAEGDDKIFVVDAFDSSSPAFQNKLLKSLEEPPEGVMFLLGCAGEAAVLPTVRSRVKRLEIPPFPEDEIYACLERDGRSPKNREAAAACGGVLGTARKMARGDAYDGIEAAARRILNAGPEDAAGICSAYGDFPYGTELISRMQAGIYEDLRAGGPLTVRHGAPAMIAGSEYLTRAAGDMRQNAQLQQVLLGFILRISEEDRRWRNT